MARNRTYLVFGLRLESEIELPELLQVEEEAQADVQISLGEPDENRPVDMHSADGFASYRIDGVASYDIADGSKIIVRPDPGTSERNVRLYLLGSVMGMLLHQRGLLPLHATAVECDGSVLAIMGHSGAGKSTLAAWFYDNDYQVVADDVCVVSFDETRKAWVQPGIPRLRLWKDMLDATGRTGPFERSYAGDDSWDKFDVPVKALTEALPLGAVVLLAEGSTPGLERLIGVKAVDAILSNVYRGSYLSMTDQTATTWSTCLEIATSFPVYLWKRRVEFHSRDRDTEELLLKLRDFGSFNQGEVKRNPAFGTGSCV